MPFGSILGGLASGAIGLLGSRRGQSGADDRAQAMLAASRPVDVLGPFGMVDINEAGDFTISPSDRLGSLAAHLQGLSDPVFGLLSDPNFVGSEVNRLRSMAQPREDALRSQLRSQLFNQGRLGAGVGGGISGRMFNPELAALEEGLARADLARVGAARGEQQRLLGNLFGLLGAETDIRGLPLQQAQLSSAGRASSAGLTGLSAAAARAGNANDAFFGSLAQTIGELDFGSLFGGGGGGLSGPVRISNTTTPMQRGLFFG